MMEEYLSESDSDYTSYWRDWVSHLVLSFCLVSGRHVVDALCYHIALSQRSRMGGTQNTRRKHC